MGKVAVVVGHNEKLKGAYCEFLKIYEWDFYKKVVEEIQELDTEKKIDVYFRNYKGSYKKEMTELTDKLNKTDYTLVIELHFNKVLDEAPAGAEVLVFKSKDVYKKVKGVNKRTRKGKYSKIGKLYGTKFLDELTKFYGHKSRGLKPVKIDTDRGGMGICHTKAAYILIEPFFASNEEDAERFRDIKKFAGFLYKFMMEVE